MAALEEQAPALDAVMSHGENAAPERAEDAKPTYKSFK
jgi:hypothetical protein